MHNLVAIELAYINTKHPDFTDAAQVSASVNSQQVVVCPLQQIVTCIIYSALLNSFGKHMDITTAFKVFR